MAEFIYKQDLLARLNIRLSRTGDFESGYNSGMDCAVRKVKNTPVIEIIHCKDCIHNVANMGKDPLDETDYTDITCDYFMTDGMSPEDFCSKGERVTE